MSINGGCKQHRKRKEGITIIETNISGVNASLLAQKLGMELISLVNNDDFYLNKSRVDMNDKAI